MMTKSILYQKARDRGIPVKWIGTTIKYLRTLLDLQDIIDEKIQFTIPEPDEKFVAQFENMMMNTPIMALVTFEVKKGDDYTFQFEKQFRSTTRELTKIINDYMNRENYDNESIKEIDRRIINLDINAAENNILNRQLLKYNSPDISKYVKNSEWNHTVNECVIDYISKRLSTHSTTIKKYFTDFITANDIIAYAKQIHVNIYILHFNKLIYKEINNIGHKHTKVLCFEIRNNHVYPVNDRKIISKIMKEGNSKFKKTEEYTNNFGNIVFNNNKNNGIRYLLQTMKQTNTQPFGSINMIDGKINSFILDDTLYVAGSKDPKIEQYCNDHNIPYYGQSLQLFMRKYLDQIPKSFMNHQVLHALNAGIKSRTHNGLYLDRKNQDTDVLLDLNRCYSTCLKYPYEEFMIIDFDTIIHKTNKLHGLGLYYVITNDNTLLHGNNWYSHYIINLALQEGIGLTITHYISGKASNFNFDNIINEITIEFANSSKMAINSLIGFFAKTKRSTGKLFVSTDFDDTIPSLREKNPVLIEEDGIYIFGNERIEYLHQNYLPFWIQILDWSNIRLHKLIQEHGNYDNLVFRKTDCAMMRQPNNLHPSTEWGGYKIEAKKIGTEKERIITAPLIIINQKQETLAESNIQQHINDGKSLLLLGRAGTGKSYIINEYSKSHNTIRLAYTNKAANNINGITLHKFFKIGSNDSINMKKSLHGIDAIFIDEISMIPKYIWSLIIDLKNVSNVPIILVGDHRQLPPVDEEDHINNPSIKWITDYYKCELTTMRRYDKELWDYLEHPYHLQESLFDSTATHICHTNKCVNRINELMNWIHVPNPKLVVGNMRLDIGLPILAIHTSKTNNIIKNESYIITEITTNYIKISNNSTISVSLFDKLFTLGYAMTTHKMQGSTVHGRLQIHEITPSSNKRLFYTAYSRATKLSDITYCN